MLDSNGSQITSVEWRANRLVDGLAKAAAQQGRVPANQGQSHTEGEQGWVVAMQKPTPETQVGGSTWYNGSHEEKKRHQSAMLSFTFKTNKERANQTIPKTAHAEVCTCRMGKQANRQQCLQTRKQQRREQQIRWQLQTDIQTNQ